MSYLSNNTIVSVRKFWNDRPCNIRHSLKQVGSKGYFDEVEVRKYFVESHIPNFAEFKHWKDKKVLEIGCGIGTDTINFARAGAFVTAVELSENSLGIAKQRAEIYKMQGRIRFYSGNAEELASFIPAEHYDLIYSFGVIHHTPHPERILEQVRSYMHSGSIIKIMVYNRYSWKVFWILLKYGKLKIRKIRELISEYSEANTGCPITHTFTKKEIKDLLIRKGFKINSIQICHIFPYRISDYTQYRYVKNWYFRYLPQSSFNLLQRYFGWHICITAGIASR